MPAARVAATRPPSSTRVGAAGRAGLGSGSRRSAPSRWFSSPSASRPVARRCQLLGRNRVERGPAAIRAAPACTAMAGYYARPRRAARGRSCPFPLLVRRLDRGRRTRPRRALAASPSTNAAPSSASGAPSRRRPCTWWEPITNARRARLRRVRGHSAGSPGRAAHPVGGDQPHRGERGRRRSWLQHAVDETAAAGGGGAPGSGSGGASRTAPTWPGSGPARRGWRAPCRGARDAPTTRARRAAPTGAGRPRSAGSTRPGEACTCHRAMPEECACPDNKGWPGGVLSAGTRPGSSSRRRLRQ